MSYEQLTESVARLATVNADLKSTVVVVRTQAESSRDAAQAFAINAVAVGAEVHAELLTAEMAAEVAAGVKVKEGVAAHNHDVTAHPELAAFATVEANRATAAADVAQLSAGIYDTTALGLAATTTGKYFSVPSAIATEHLILYKNNAGTASLIKSYPSADYVLTLRPEIYDLSGRAPVLRNLFDVARSTDGFYIDTVGGATADALYYMSDYIPISESQQHVFALTTNSFAFYNFNKSFISRQAGATGGTPFTPPVAAQFMRFSSTLSTKKNKQMLVKGNVLPSGYLGFGYTDPATQDKKTHAKTLELLADLASGVTNLFDSSRTTDDTALATDGGTYAATGYFVSRLTPIKNSTSYVMSRGSNPVCFYDANKQKISDIATTTGVAFTSPVDACYIRFHAQPLTQKSTLMLVEGTSLPPSYVAFGSPTSASVSKTALEVARTVLEATQPTVRNLFDLNRAQLDRAISAINGGTYSAVGYFITGKLPVTPGGSFVSTYGPNQLCFYDVNGNFLSGSTDYNSYGNLPVPVPVGAYYIQFQVGPLTRLSSLVVSPGDAVPAGYIPFGGTTSKLPWQDKKLVILGDSISATGLYVPALVAGTGMSLLANHAVAGRPVREMGKTKAGVTLQSSDLATVDVISIFGATNDYGGGRALGSMTDAYPNSTVPSFYNDVYQLLTLLYTLKPTIRVVFSTPLKRGAFEGQPTYPAANNVGAKLDHYVNAIIEVCALFSVPVCNLFRDGGFNELNLTAFTSDNLHPNVAGSAVHVRPMIATINAS